MVKSTKWKNKKKAVWIDHDPTPEEMYEQFSAAIGDQVRKYKNGFQMSPEECDDMEHDLIVKILSIAPEQQRQVWTVMRAVRNAAATSMSKMRGKTKTAVLSKTQRTVSLTEYKEEESTDYVQRLIAKAASVLPDHDLHIAMERVRKALSGAALTVMDWVLDKRELHHVRGLTLYCKEELGMTSEGVSSVRMEIVRAMHSNGLALNYPPPIPPPPRKNRRAGRPSGMSMTATERLMWLDDLRANYKTRAEAARAAGVKPRAVDYHCFKLHGCNYSEWTMRKSQIAAD